MVDENTSISKETQSALGTDMSGPVDKYFTKMQQYTAPEREKAQKAQEDIVGKQIEMQRQAAEQKYNLAQKQAGEMSGIIGQYGKQLMAEPPKRQIEKDTMEGMVGLGALLPIAGAFFGGKGLTSATGALNAMAGLVKGYQEGNKDRIAFEQKKYDDAMKEFDRHQTQIKAAFDLAIKGAQVNQTAAQAKLEMDLAALNAPMLKAIVQQQGIVKGAETNIQMYDNYLKQKLQHEEKIQTAKEIAEARSGIKTSSQAVQAGQRMINATAGAASGFEAITGIKGGTTTGILPFLSTKEGITNFLSNRAGRQLSSDDAKILDVYYTGIGRNLAAIEASGAATGLVGLTKSFEALKPMAGDSNYVVAAKLADAKRVVEETMKAAVSSGTLTADQKKTSEDLIKRIEKAIPFTIEDVNKAVTKGKPTIGEVTEKSVKQAPIVPPASLSSEDQAAVNWIKQNPSDPRAERMKDILRKKGVQVD